MMRLPRRCGRRSIYLGCMRCFEKGLSHSPFSKFPFKILEVFGVCVWGSSCPRAFLLSLRLLNFLISSFDALRPRGGPLLSAPAESRQRLAKEGCAPFGIPPTAVALECLRHNRARGVTELLAAARQELPRRFAEALPQKPVSGAGAMRVSRNESADSPLWGTWGQGGEAPKRSGGGAAIVASAHALAAFPNGTEAPAAQAARSSANPDSAARLGGFQRGASSTPLWSGDSQGGETPLRLSLPTFCRSRK